MAGLVSKSALAIAGSVVALAAALVAAFNSATGEAGSTVPGNAFPNWRLLVQRPRSPQRHYRKEGTFAHEGRKNDGVFEYVRDNSPWGSNMMKAPSWLDKITSDLVERLTGSQSKQMSSVIIDDSNPSTEGTVVRLAVRSYSPKSKPSSRGYTTRKDSQTQISVSRAGVEGDYNHYRTLSLKGTPDRAVSILTTDVLKVLRAEGKFKVVQDGDLGENILVDGVGLGYFVVGSRYVFRQRRGGSDDGGGFGVGTDDEKEGLVLEITEPIVPCANLCKLPYINMDSLNPIQRIQKCQDFLDRLGKKDGFRGWYAKIVGGERSGMVRIGDVVMKLGDVSGATGAI